jgi:ligand-binding SRPBCC domain-containing protein
MPRIQLVTHIDAPRERVFDLARSVDLHMASTAASKETVVAGVRNGLMGLGDSVTWRARHFGVWHKLTSEITQFSPPAHFRDSMVRGSFRRFDHDHSFEPSGAGSENTVMYDVFDFTSPFGLLGRLVNRFLLTKYMRLLLEERNRIIKKAAETDEWSLYLRPGTNSNPGGPLDEPKSPDHVLEGGELYVFLDERIQSYRFAKVLAAFPEAGVAFVRTYQQKFASPPDEVSPSSLTVGSLEDPDGPTIGCAPIRYQSILEEWMASPNYGWCELSEEELGAVDEIIESMNAEGEDD